MLGLGQLHRADRHGREKWHVFAYYRCLTNHPYGGSVAVGEGSSHQRRTERGNYQRASTSLSLLWEEQRPSGARGRRLSTLPSPLRRYVSQFRQRLRKTGLPNREGHLQLSEENKRCPGSEYQLTAGKANSWRGGSCPGSDHGPQR